MVLAADIWNIVAFAPKNVVQQILKDSAASE